MEHSQVISDESEPFLILFILELNGIISNGFKAVVLYIEKVIGRVLESLLNGFIHESDHISKEVNYPVNDLGEGPV